MKRNRVFSEYLVSIVLRVLSSGRVLSVCLRLRRRRRHVLLGRTTEKKGERTESLSILLVWIRGTAVLVVWFVRGTEFVAWIAWLVGALPVDLILVVFINERTGRSVIHTSRVCNGWNRQEPRTTLACRHSL